MLNSYIVKPPKIKWNPLLLKLRQSNKFIFKYYSPIKIKASRYDESFLGDEW